MINEFLEKYNINEEQFNELLLDVEEQDRDIINQYINLLEKLADKKNMYMEKLQMCEDDVKDKDIDLEPDDDDIYKDFKEIEGETKIEMLERKGKYLDVKIEKNRHRQCLLEIKRIKDILEINNSTIESIEDSIKMLVEFVVEEADKQVFIKFRDKLRNQIKQIEKVAKIYG